MKAKHGEASTDRGGCEGTDWGSDLVGICLGILSAAAELCVIGLVLTNSILMTSNNLSFQFYFSLWGLAGSPQNSCWRH